MRVNDPNDLMFVALWCDVYSNIDHVPYLIESGGYAHDSSG